MTTCQIYHCVSSKVDVKWPHLIEHDDVIIGWMYTHRQEVSQIALVFCKKDAWNVVLGQTILPLGSQLFSGNIATADWNPRPQAIKVACRLTRVCVGEDVDNQCVDLPPACWPEDVPIWAAQGILAFLRDIRGKAIINSSSHGSSAQQYYS